MLGLLLDGDGVEVGVELHDAEALGVVDVVAEHGGQATGLGVLHRAAQVPAQAVAVEDVVPEDERAGLPPAIPPITNACARPSGLGWTA